MEIPHKQKLLIVITKSNFGGAQRYVYDLARSLKDQYDVVVACGGEGLMKSNLVAAGIRTVSIPGLERDIRFFKDAWTFIWFFRFLRHERPAILHVNSSKIGGIGAFVGRIVGIPRIVFTAHAWAFNENRSAAAKALIAFFHWLTVMLAHTTIAVSGAVKGQISQLPFMKQRIRVVHLGLEPYEPLLRLEAREKLGIAADALSIGTIAELHPVKGLTYALDAVKNLPFECSYTIIGTGDLEKELAKQIKESPVLQRRAVLVGFVKDAARYASAFDIFILPSLSEAFGYVLLEAGYAKTAVIASSVGGIPEIITDMESGILIHPKNSKEIKSSLEFLAENTETRKKFGESLYQSVSTEFTLEHMVEKTIEVYKAGRV